ncbi:MAG: hypothetical protein EAZ95_19485 [Bacteroidetes bacterium]|nr:MAG: hypothetical protein EAZ95_19485 [Bacteroidota bacterium]
MNILINQEQTSFAKEHTKDFPVQPVSIDAKAGKGSKKHFSIIEEDTPAFQHFLLKMAQEAETELKTNKKSYNNIDDLINALQVHCI